MGDESELQTNSNQDDVCAILVHGNRYPCAGSTEGLKHDEPKYSHTKNTAIKMSKVKRENSKRSKRKTKSYTREPF